MDGPKGFDDELFGILLAKAMEVRNFRERDGSAYGGSEIAFVASCHCASSLRRVMTTIITWNIRASGIKFVDEYHPPYKNYHDILNA